MDDETESATAESAGPPPLELLRSYQSFGLRAVRKRLLLAIALFVGVVGVAVAALAVWPRTYSCEMKLMVQSSPLFEAPPEPLRGASNLIRRRENLQLIVDRVELVKHWRSQRAPVLQLKDRLMARIRGDVPDSIMRDLLVNTLAGALWVDEQERSLTIGVSWPHPQMAARLVEAARETFMESRHATEIAGFEEKMAIWDQHATNVRTEVTRIAEDLQRRRQDQRVKAQKASAELAASGPNTPGRAAPVRRVAAAAEPVSIAVPPDPNLPELKAQLQAKKQRLAELEAEQDRRVREARSKITNLKADLTAEHPLVLQAERMLETLSTPPAELTSTRTDVRVLSDDIGRREELARSIAAGATNTKPTSTTKVAGTTTASAPAMPDLLPSHVMDLLQDDAELDPTVGAQLHSAVEKYTTLRGQIATARVELDTAQAAFNHRYKIVFPTEVPAVPSKPVVPKVLAICVLAALLLALLVPILLELKRGLIVERWQLYQLQLPILPEATLPSEALTSRKSR